MDRRLAAILAADVAGYSALSGADEGGTLRALKGHMGALEPLIGLNGGRIVKTMGDGFLAEFPSVVDAVACAETMQRQMAERNAARGDGPELRFRIGVHVGDIVADGDDILGDGVNIAARLEGVAEPGGVVVSGRVHEDVAGKLDLAFRDLGPQDLKNIARPVPAFAIEIGQAAAPAPAPSRPDKPSVAVLAFDNLSSDPEQDYFADGITEDIITGLSRVPWIFVIARNSSFSYKGLSVDIRRVGRELGVRYVLEGSVRKSGQRLRVTGQLIDAETGNHVWADRYDGLLEDVFDLQDSITEAVVAAIAPGIRQAEMERAARKRPEVLDAYDHFLRAQSAISLYRFREAALHLDEATARAPVYAEAIALRAWIDTIQWHPDIVFDEAARATALRSAEEVLATPDSDIEARAFAGYVIAFFTEDFERGLGHVLHAVEQCPSCISAWCSSCLLNGMHGNSEIALAHGEAALKLSPRDPMSYRAHMGMSFADLEHRDFESLLARAEQLRAFRNTVIVFQYYETAANAHLGRLDRARELAGKLITQNPSMTIDSLRQRRSPVAAIKPGIYDPIYDGLAMAGIPE